MQISKRVFVKENVRAKFNLNILDVTYSPMSIINLQTAFYLWMLGYVLAVVCFVTEIVVLLQFEWAWHNKYICLSETYTDTTDNPLALCRCSLFFFFLV
jgi:hypothetical protein